MFAPKRAKPPTKALDSSGRRTVLEPRRALKQSDMLGGHHSSERDWAAQPAPHPSWDFSKIPVLSSERPNEPPAQATLQRAPRHAQLKPFAGERSLPLEHEADCVAEQVTREGASADVDADLRSSPATAHSGASDDSREQVAGLGEGAPLEPSFRARMEPRFGHDFSGVRVHTGPEADRSALSLGAQAYTLGRHLVFSNGRYAPHTGEGQRLLAHELTHFVQQQTPGGPRTPQLKAVATRFQDEPTLDEISDGKKVLKEGDKGEAVIRITTALSELGHYTNSVIDENFDPPLTSAVSSYQIAKGLAGEILAGKVPAGKVDKATFGKLDQDFSAGFKVELGVIGKQKSADILKHTQSLDPAERKASARAISTEPPVSAITGLPPTFHENIPKKGKYGDRLTPILDKAIVDEWNSMGKGKTAEHAAGKLYDAATIDPIAVESQKAVQAVFGEYVKGKVAPPLKLGVNVGDAWAKKEADLKAGGKAAEDDAVDWRVQKILDGKDTVAALDIEHGAIQSRAAEKKIIDPIKASMITKHRAKLLETHKAWPGFADTGIVYVQLFKGKDADRQRFERWYFFQTFIHEYIHTLEHKDHVAYRGGLSAKKGSMTLREGTTDYFTKIVWNSLILDDALRAKIEGPVHDPAKKFAIQGLYTYPEANNAERLAGVVGIRNVAAAFFLGKVDLIGKP